MARDIQGNVREVLASDSARQLLAGVAGEAIKSFGSGRSSKPKAAASKVKKAADSKLGLSGVRGIAAGAGAAALAPLAARGIGKLAKGRAGAALADAPRKAVGGATAKIGDSVSSKVGEKIDQAGGPPGVLKNAVKSALPFGGGGDDDEGAGGKGGVAGVGKGRRMPVQQSVDIGVPIETVYNQWTQFEFWPNFMHRVTRVTQDDECTVKFATKIWGKTKEFTAEIETQRPDERIKWRVSEGITHTGVVTFHEVAPRLTRIELTLDVEPGGMLEKAARGMRHIKRAARGDLHRFKAFIEMTEKETGAWRGVIEDGHVVKPHDANYDKRHEYQSLEDISPKRDESGSQRNGADPEQGARQRRTGGGSRSRTRQSSAAASSGRAASGGRSRAKSSSGSRSGNSGSSSSGSRSGNSRSSSSGSRSGNSRSSSSGSSRGSSGGRTRSSRASSGANGGGQRARSSSRS